VSRAAIFFVLTVAALAHAALVYVGAEGAGKDPLLAAQWLMVRQKYPEATEQVKAILRNDPGNIDAVFTLAAIEQTRIIDYEGYTVYGRRFLTFADSLLKILDARQPALRGADSLRCLFYRASVTGAIGLVQTKRGAWVEGARSAMASANLYREVKRIDSAHLGADLGLGVYDYYVGTSLRWVPFVAGGSVEKGLEAIERGLGAPFPFNHGAKNSYSWILIDRRQFQKADSLARTALREAPGSTIFLRVRAYAALAMGNNENALSLSRELAAASESRRPVNWSDLIMANSIMASAYDNLGQRTEALATANRALALPVPEAYRAMSHVRDHYRVLNAIRNRYGR
jgi:tetratricopeptide (TPR) repeat protein